MAETIADLSKEIASLRDALLKDRVDNSDPKNPKTQVSELKEHLVQQAPKLMTEDFFKAQFAPYFKKFDDMHQELVKAKKTEWMEAAGLGSFAAAVEKFHEDSAWWPVYLVSGFLSLAVPAFLIALALNLKDMQRKIQGGIFNFLGRKWPSLRGQILASVEGGLLPRRQNAQTVRDREGGNLAGVTLTNPPDPATFDALRQALGNVNRRIINFNKAVAKMKSKAQLDKLATGVEAITRATDAAKPTDIETLAKAIDKLGDAQDKFNPRDIPKPRPLLATADAAKTLAEAGETVTQRFQKLKDDATELARIMAGGASS
ncbi:hypothetical protein [Streptomyces tanashiensis]|uniref:Uncharacterized protein n=1 Tax=Streptomyces tanashiensis TaxID=67367 RepID=A0ABY6QY86_9ACTN|nr:hypothetical protein [Streptomyces tanashiensis]UZX22282.1 hypothetical protein LDH80_16765 [Streptomyces tanashiensis]GGY06456.1 hypothetical protein GCM10010299_07360 [Streptomyces tanashiensis]